MLLAVVKFVLDQLLVSDEYRQLGKSFVDISARFALAGCSLKAKVSSVSTASDEVSTVIFF